MPAVLARIVHIIRVLLHIPVRTKQRGVQGVARDSSDHPQLSAATLRKGTVCKAIRLDGRIGSLIAENAVQIARGGNRTADRSLTAIGVAFIRPKEEQFVLNDGT